MHVIASAARRPALVSLLALGMIMWVVIGPGTSVGASGTTVVSVRVPSAVFTDVAACDDDAPGPATSFGVVLPGSPAITPAPCTVTFGSSNSAAVLRLLQEDQGGTAMHGNTTGTPQPGFGVAGLATIPGNTATNYFSPMWTSDTRPLIVKDDGTTIVGGYRWIDPNEQWPEVHKLGPDGLADPGFNGGLPVRLPFGGVVNAIAEDSQGRIVCSGFTYGTPSGTRDSDQAMAVWRLEPDGDLDLTFNGDGIAVLRTDPAADDDARNFAILPDDSIVVGNERQAGGATEFMIAKFAEDGALDTDFGGGKGWFTWTPYPGATLWNEGVEIDSRGRILATFLGDDPARPGTRQLGAVRFGQDGRLDTTFGGGDGWWEFTEAVPGWTGAVATWNEAPGPADGLIVQGSNGVNVYTVRLSSAGAPDPRFGTNGVLTLAPPATENNRTFGVTISGDTLVTTVRECCVGGATFRLERRSIYTGALDTTFDADGVLAISGNAYGLDAGADGDLAVMAYRSGSPWPTTVLRLDGAAVEDWGGSGVRDWDDGVSMFAACVQNSSNATVDPGWTSTGQCRQGIDSDPWRAVASGLTDPTAVVATSASGVSNATLGFRFGMRAAQDQAPGRYVAPLQFEVVAP